MGRALGHGCARLAAMCALGATLLFAPSAQAQIVDVLSELAPFAQDGVQLGLASRLSWRTGSTELLQVEGNGSVAYKHAAHTTYVILRGAHARNSEGIFVNQTFAHLRYRYRVLRWLAAEAFTQHEFDEQRRLRTRALLGAGPRFVLIEGERGSVAVGSAYMLEGEVYTELAGSQQSDVLNHRWSNYVQLTWLPQPTIGLQHTTFAQPRFDAFEDVRLLSQAQLSVKANSWFSLALSFRVAFDSRPPEGVPRTDTDLGSSIELSATL